MQKFLNNFETTFVASVKDSPGTATPATELDYGILRLSDGAAAFLTNPNPGDFYVLTAYKRDGTMEVNQEIMKVTAVDNTQPGECRITVERGQEGTTVRSYLAGDRISLRLTAGAANNWVAQFDIAKNNADIATNQANIATNQANIATNQANIATDKANIATNQANIATDKANIATNQAAAAAASYDSFDDRYLGAKASDPTLDNDGNALIEGALYWNSTAKETRTWNGTAWVTTSVANAVSRGGDTMTGPLSVPAGATGAQVPQAQETYGPKNGQLAGMRNKIINGKMEIAQRGASFSAIVNAYSIDRWLHSVVDTTGLTTDSLSSDVPASSEFQNSLRSTVTSADAAVAAGDISVILQRIEGYNARDLVGRTFTFSFWVRSSKTGTHCVYFVNSGFDRSYVAEYSINAANTWEQKSITVSGGLPTAGTWNYTNGIGLGVGWALAAGSNFHTTPNAWQTGNFVATANQVNCLDTVGNIFAITGVQLEVGEVATPFEHRPYGTELTLCQRYYEKSYRQSLAPGATTGVTSADALCFGDFPASTVFYIQAPFLVEKRGVPTIRVWDAVGNINRCSTQAGNNQIPGSGNLAASVSTRSFHTDFTISGMTRLIALCWDASAEL